MTAWLPWLVIALLITAPAPVNRLSDSLPPAPKRAVRFQRMGNMLPGMAGIAMVVFLIAGRASIMAAVLIVLVTAAHLVDAALSQRRSRRVEAVASTVLGHVIADLRSGSLIAPAFTRAAADLPESTPPAVRDTFAAVATHVARGGAGHTALAATPELTGLARIWALAESHGLPAAALLEQARDRLAAHARHRSATSASLQGPQATAMILATLPLAGIMLGSGMGADPLGFLLSGGLGGILLIVGVSLICGGLILARMIIVRAGA